MLTLRFIYKVIAFLGHLECEVEIYSKGSSLDCLFCEWFFLLDLFVRMMRWLTTLPTHTYSNEGMMESRKNRVSVTNNIAEAETETTEKKHTESEEISSNKKTVVSSEVENEMKDPSHVETSSTCFEKSSTEKKSENEQTEVKTELSND